MSDRLPLFCVLRCLALGVLAELRDVVCPNHPRTGAFPSVNMSHTDLRPCISLGFLIRDAVWSAKLSKVCGGLTLDLRTACWTSLSCYVPIPACSAENHATIVKPEPAQASRDIVRPSREKTLS